MLDTALDPQSKGVARRCGVIRTSHVLRRTTLLLLRIRYHLTTRSGEAEQELLAEDCALAAFAGAPDQAEWLDDEAAESLLTAVPSGNVLHDQAAAFVTKVIEGSVHLMPHLESVAQTHSQELLDAHLRVRRAARMRTARQSVKAQLPLDVLGVYVFLPLGGVA